jgi:hypothetical protein
MYAAVFVDPDVLLIVLNVTFSIHVGYDMFPDEAQY